MAAGAGLRFGEATGLTVPRVDFLRRRLQVLEQAQNGALAPLKTRASPARCRSAIGFCRR
jgi:hypothetical protein